MISYNIDKEEILELIKKAHKESFYKDYELNLTHFCEILDLISKNKAFGIVLKKDKQTVGFLLATKGMPEFCNIRIGLENGFYIKPEYRNFFNAKSLIDEFKNWCKRENLKPMLNFHYGEFNDKLYKFAYKMGFLERGRYFIG